MGRPIGLVTGYLLGSCYKLHSPHNERNILKTRVTQGRGVYFCPIQPMNTLFADVVPASDKLILSPISAEYVVSKHMFFQETQINMIEINILPRNVDNTDL